MISYKKAENYHSQAKKNQICQTKIDWKYQAKVEKKEKKDNKKRIKDRYKKILY